MPPRRTQRAMRFGRFVRIGVVAGLAAGALLVGERAKATNPGDTLAGCQSGTSTTAVEFHGDLSPVPAGVPSAEPCLVATGFGGAETQIVSLNDGTLVYEPAVLTPGLAGTGFVPGAPGPQPSTQFSPGGLAVSSDEGSTWGFNRPAGATWVPQDDALYVDRVTGRLFFYALAANPVPTGGAVAAQDQVPAGEAHLMASADNGRTWTETGLPGYVESENPRFASAPPPAGATAPAGGYADVTYWCGNDAVNLGMPLPGYRACYRSLDGGESWQFASVLASGPVPQHTQCAKNAETFADLDPNYPEGAPDGSLYSEVTCGGTTYLARSTDEASTWPLVTDGTGRPVTLPADGELRVGPDGHLYLAYLTGTNTIDLRVSADGGRTWTHPVDMTAPAVRSTNGSVVQWAFAERGNGEAAVSYLVQRGGLAVYDGYLSFTRDAEDAQPLLFASALNPLSTPMRDAAPAQARDDFVGVDIAPDGTPWASFAASCPGPVGGATGTAACAGQSSDPEANEAVAGRLAF